MRPDFATDPTLDGLPERGLAPGEALLVACVRAWALARCADQVPHGPVIEALRDRASSHAAAFFVAWMEAVEASRRRPIAVQRPGCCKASEDVRRLVASCGLAAVDPDRSERLLAPLCAEPQSVVVLARSLNAALAACGWPLPARLGQADAGVTVH